MSLQRLLWGLLDSCDSILNRDANEVRDEASIRRGSLFRSFKKIGREAQSDVLAQSLPGMSVSVAAMLSLSAVHVSQISTSVNACKECVPQRYVLFYGAREGAEH